MKKLFKCTKLPRDSDFTVGEIYDLARETDKDYFIYDDKNSSSAFTKETWVVDGKSYKDWFELIEKEDEEGIDPESSSVCHPKHYNKGKIEVWDFIIDQKMNFLEGNIVKYLSRWKEKGKLEDLEKMKAYLDKLIDINK